MNNQDIIANSIQKAVKSGFTGYGAMSLQVVSLMWLRTTVNYQYKNGTQFRETLSILYKQGGIPRFYRGLVPALFQAPLSRFGDIATNTGVMYYLNYNESTQTLPIPLKTFIGSMFAGLWRINLMPIDTCKTINQVHGKKGYQILKNKIRVNGVGVLYHGGFGAFSNTLMGHFPWFFTYNTLSSKIPKIDNDNIFLKMTRLAAIGFTSSFVSDSVSNVARVVKVSKQTSTETESYRTIVKKILNEGGLKELFGRGLKTKIIINGVQGVVFVIAWNTIQDVLN